MNNISQTTVTPDIINAVSDFLRAYQGNSNFLQSVKGQLERRGLSERQYLTVYENNLKPKAPAPVLLQQVTQSTYAVGTVLELKSFIARKLAEQFGMKFQFRNVEIIETLRETQKAVQVRIRLSPRYNTCCCVCGRELDTQISRATGIGPVCAGKWGVDRYSAGDAKDIIAQLEAQLGQVKMDEPVWIARSQIKGVLAQQAA